ncbi:MAG: hypothetical protein ACLFTB_05980 [Desulfovibrionales bacterium]
MAKKTAVQTANRIEKWAEEAREMALTEIKDLKADVLVVERSLSGKRKKPLSTAPLFDIIHGALEVYRHVSKVLESEELLAAMEDELGKAKERAYLEKCGAILLTKPEGWHWISPKGEMVLLGRGEELDKAAQKLKKLRSGKRATGTTKAQSDPEKT